MKMWTTAPLGHKGLGLGHHYLVLAQPVRQVDLQGITALHQPKPQFRAGPLLGFGGQGLQLGQGQAGFSPLGQGLHLAQGVLGQRLAFHRHGLGQHHFRGGFLGLGLAQFIEDPQLRLLALRFVLGFVGGLGRRTQQALGPQCGAQAKATNQ